MNIFIPFLMLVVPGIIAVSLHEKKLINVTRENWQRLLWVFLLYSFGIMLSVCFVLWIDNTRNTISFSPWTLAGNHVLRVSFIVKYSILAVIVALILPWTWNIRNSIVSYIKNIVKKSEDDDLER